MRLSQEGVYLDTEKGNHATGRSGRVDGRKHLFPGDDGMLGAFMICRPSSRRLRGPLVPSRFASPHPSLPRPSHLRKMSSTGGF